MPQVKYLKSGEIAEDSIQKTVIHWTRFHPVLKNIVIHIPNEGKRSPQYGRNLKAMGLMPGVWDLLVACGRHGYIGAWIELKSAEGRLSPYQMAFGKHMEQQNYYTAVCYSIDDAIKKIEWYYNGD